MTAAPRTSESTARARRRETEVGDVRSDARAPDGARAGGRVQARAAIASTSFQFGKRPVAFFE